MNYRLLIDYEVIEFLETLSRKDQRSLRDRFVVIRENPSGVSDFTERDPTDRCVDIHVFGRFAIKYWQDYADQHIKIMDVHLADRPKP